MQQTTFSQNLDTNLPQLSASLSFANMLTSPSFFNKDNVYITREQYDLISSPVPWSRADRTAVIEIMHNVAYGSLAYMGLKPFPLPAEHYAVFIALVVSTVNRLLCCQWCYDSLYTQSQLLDNTDVSAITPTVAPHQLAILVSMLFSNTRFGRYKVIYDNSVRQMFIGIEGESFDYEEEKK